MTKKICNSFYSLWPLTIEHGHLMTVFQASGAFGVSRQRIYFLLAEGHIPGIVVFGVLMVGRRDLVKRLSSCQSTVDEADCIDSASTSAAVLGSVTG